jgi:hypothetical protein
MPNVGHVVINFAASLTLIKGSTGKRIRVLSAVLDVNGGSATWKFQSSASLSEDSPINLTGNLFLSSGPSSGATATGALVLDHNPEGWFQTEESQDLLLVLVSGTQGITGCLTFDLV